MSETIISANSSDAFAKFQRLSGSYGPWRLPGSVFLPGYVQEYIKLTGDDERAYDSQGRLYKFAIIPRRLAMAVLLPQFLRQPPLSIQGYVQQEKHNECDFTELAQVGLVLQMRTMGEWFHNTSGLEASYLFQIGYPLADNTATKVIGGGRIILSFRKSHL